MGKKRGFTLVELLVVIAIIALLMSMLMPALGRAKRQAKLVLCQSNLKQLGVCFTMYANDWDGRMLRGWTPAGTQPQHYWMEALRFCYGDDGDIRVCPMAARTSTSVGQGPWGGVNPDATFYGWGVFAGVYGETSTDWECAIAGDYGSYAMNAYVNDPPLSAGTYQGHEPKWNWRSTNVRGTANIPLISAGQWIDAWPHFTNDPPRFQGQRWDNVDMVTRVCLNRHEGYINVCFMDYTVRKVGLKELWKCKWNRMFDLDGGPTPEQFDTLAPWMKKFKDHE